MVFPTNIQIGLTFKGKTTSKSKRCDDYTVVDIHTTTNAAGEVVSKRYVIEHEFMRQKIRQTECQPTICRMMYNAI